MDRAEQEWCFFKENFVDFTDKKIVLYGVGRGTANLVSKNDVFEIVGLMDKDQTNVGIVMYGLPVLSLKEAEKRADMIIISAPETYWRLIYKRIQESKIPVYFRNGEKAYIKEKQQLTLEMIQEKLEELSVDNLSNEIVNHITKKLIDKDYIKKDNYDRLAYNSYFSFGYCLWGPIVYVFCEWLYLMSQKKDIDSLFFLSRDGYLLQKDYDFFVTKNKLLEAPKSKYLLSSRRIAMVASIESEQDYCEWVKFPFSGTFSEYMWNRFMIDIEKDEYSKERIQMPHDNQKVCLWMRKYKKEIRDSIKRDRDLYRKYVNNMGLSEKSAIVDIGYTGNIQKKLSQIIEKSLKGFYFVCDLSRENHCLKNNELYSCFQDEQDYKANGTCIYRRPQLLESMFTAPYGMVMTLDENFEKICEKISENQKYFEEREEINRGIQAFISDMGHMENVSEQDIKINRRIVDKMFGVLIENISFGKKIENIFYWEDIIVQTRENKMFE